MNVNIEIDWKAVWRDFNKWFDKENDGNPDWIQQTRKIQSLIRNHMDVFQADSDDEDDSFVKEVYE